MRLEEVLVDSTDEQHVLQLATYYCHQYVVCHSHVLLTITAGGFVSDYNISVLVYIM